MEAKAINKINVLVISPLQFSRSLIEALINENAFDNELCVSSCESVEEVDGFHHNSEETHKRFKFDYVILVVDTILVNGLQKAESEIGLLPNYYLTTRRIFFVSSDLLNLDGFWQLNNKYKSPAVVGDLSEPKGCASIARRALKLIEFSGGKATGLPFVGVD